MCLYINPTSISHTVQSATHTMLSTHTNTVPPPSCCLAAELAASVQAKDFDSWGSAPACSYKGPGLPDKLGRQWGYQNGQSCAFREAAAPQAPNWDVAAECSYKLTETNSLTDKVGRRWGYEGGKSCAFKTQILSTVAPRPPPPPPAGMYVCMRPVTCCFMLLHDSVYV